MAGLLTSDKGPTGETRLSDWLQSKGEAIGQQYLETRTETPYWEEGFGQ